MARPAQPKTRANRLVGGVVLLGVAVLLGAMLLQDAFATGVGRLLADIWVTVMGAIAGLLGGVFGG